MTLTIQKSGLHYIFMTKFLTKIMNKKTGGKREKEALGEPLFSIKNLFNGV